MQQRFQLAHVLEAQVERLEARNGRLGEIVSVQLAHRQAHVPLRESELYPALLERLGELFELFQVGGFLGGRFEGTGRGRVLLHLGSVRSGGGGRGGEDASDALELVHVGRGRLV